MKEVINAFERKKGKMRLTECVNQITLTVLFFNSLDLKKILTFAHIIKSHLGSKTLFWEIYMNLHKSREQLSGN